MNQLTFSIAFLALLCAQVLAVQGEQKGESGFNFADDTQLDIQGLEEEESRLRQLVDYIKCIIYQRFLKGDEDICEQEEYNVAYDKRGKGIGTLGLMFGRRSADFTKRNGRRPQQTFS
ncbi:uncharacterized protein LOC144448477 isoform X2 [Glandiceps talaboti]